MSDSGMVWERVAFPSSSAQIVKSGGKGVWLAADNDYLYRTEDNGQTWQEVYGPLYGWGNIRLDTDRNGVWIVYSDEFGGRSIRSVDDGRTWSEVDIPVTVQRLAADRKGGWLAFGFYDGAARSDDNGATWYSVPRFAGLPDPMGLVEVTDLRTDGNGVWLAAVSFSPVWRRSLVLSVDNGNTWSLPESGPSTGSAPAYIRAMASDGKGVWLAGGYDELFRSTDGGRTWEQVFPPYPPPNIVCIATDGKGVWIVACDDRWLLRSTDNGITWPPLLNEFEYELGSARGIDADGNGVWLAATDFGMFRSAPGIGFWTGFKLTYEIP